MSRPGVGPELPTPLVQLLHGAGATAQHGLDLLIGQADDARLVLLAPSSQGETWDLLLGGYGPDAAWTNRALAEVFQRLPVDSTRLAVGSWAGTPFPPAIVRDAVAWLGSPAPDT
jgi:phospholipase/carboxylesterase